MSQQIIEEIRRVGAKVDALTQGLVLLADGQRAMAAVVDGIHKACTADRPTSPLLDPLKQLAAAVQESTAVLRDLQDSVEAQPEAVRRAVRDELERKDG